MSISHACTCRVQASVRLLKMLRHIITKVKILVQCWHCPPPKCCSSLPLWVFEFCPGLPGVPFFLEFWDYYKWFIFDFRPDLFRWLVRTSDFGRWRWGDGGVKVGGLAPSMGLSWIVIPFNPPLSSLCNYNAHVIWIVQKRTKKSKRPKSTLAADVSSKTSILPEIYPDTNRLWVHPLTSQAHHLAMDSIPWKSKCFRHTDWIYNAHMLLELMLAIKALRVGFHGKQPERG